MSNETPRDGQQGGDLPQGELDGTHDAADRGVAQQGTQRAASLDGAAERQEKTGANGASNAQHGQMAFGEASLEMLDLGGRDEIAIVVVDGGGVSWARRGFVVRVDVDRRRMLGAAWHGAVRLAVSLVLLLLVSSWRERPKGKRKKKKNPWASRRSPQAGSTLPDAAWLPMPPFTVEITASAWIT